MLKALAECARSAWLRPKMRFWETGRGSTSVWRVVLEPEEMRFVQHSYTLDVLYGDRFKARQKRQKTSKDEI